MAHECPECNCKCTCGGDIDDLMLGEAKNGCSHCDINDEDNDDIPDEPSYYGCNSCGLTSVSRPVWEGECPRCTAIMEEQYY